MSTTAVNSTRLELGAGDGDLLRRGSLGPSSAAAAPRSVPLRDSRSMRCLYSVRLFLRVCKNHHHTVGALRVTDFKNKQTSADKESRFCSHLHKCPSRILSTCQSFKILYFHRSDSGKTTRNWTHRLFGSEKVLTEKSERRRMSQHQQDLRDLSFHTMPSQFVSSRYGAVQNCEEFPALLCTSKK